ncbi:Zn-dependent hydrolase [Natronorarus salvus]|uniref:Zn-dependent hydrolase n=1 Tax=Natronorarus salvus TaxID=3117733 RepID=UPI002F2606A6
MIEIDPERFCESFDRYAEIGATENGGLDRLTCTEADREARDALVSDAEAIGLDVRVDGIGNVFARREGLDPDADPVLIGSHLDSQPKGGRFDGQLGVLAALETLRAFEDGGVETDRPVELVDWTNEEGSRFEQAMLGSAVFAGRTSLSEALSLTDDTGTSLGEALSEIGYRGEPGEIDPAACLELHVEQGPRLEERGVSVGIVEGVFGMAWLRVTIEGEANHAGPTPMHARKDALAAAVDAIDAIGELPGRLSPEAVATVGRISVEPDSINVIPARATFTVDVRADSDTVVDRAIERVERELAAACDRHGTTFDLDERWRSDRVTFSPVVRNALAAAAESRDVAVEHLPSGAGHDAVSLAPVAESGMVFVPSAEGITHNEREFTPWEDAVAGARVFAGATYDLATE